MHEIYYYLSLLLPIVTFQKKGEWFALKKYTLTWVARPTNFCITCSSNLCITRSIENCSTTVIYARSYTGLTFIRPGSGGFTSGPQSERTYLSGGRGSGVLNTSAPTHRRSSTPPGPSTLADRRRCRRLLALSSTPIGPFFGDKSSARRDYPLWPRSRGRGVSGVKRYAGT